MRTVIVLAAGLGKRMKSDLPKVLHPLLGRTLLGHVLAASEEAFPGARTVVVVGSGADLVRDHLATIAPDALTALQPEQRGTGHAVRCALSEVGDVEGTVVVLNGDLPLITPATLADLAATHDAGGAAATVLSADLPAPNGMGRIVRRPDGSVERVVEERDASPEEWAITEINAGAYVFEAPALREALSKLSTDNDQGEEYLTDVVGLLVGSGRPVLAHRAGDAVEVLGCNDRAELAVLRDRLRDRVNLRWMREGVTLLDPASTWIDVTVTVGRDAVVEPQTQLRGSTVVGAGALVGPDSTLVDVVVGAGAQVVRAHAVSARIGDGASVGPYAYLRPGTVLGVKSKVGTFVETKNAELGDGAKVPHLSYIGDASVGEHSNVGAASVTVNYDGVNKHRTRIGAHARTGADTMFVAPVSVGDGAYTAAGSVITTDVPPGALAVARGQQRNVEGWVGRKRPGTAAAEAAAAAGSDVLHDEAAAAGGPDPGDRQ